jgi:hypothetical protein
LARQMSAEKEVEFIELSKFLEYYSTVYTKIERSSDMHPSNVLVTIIEKCGRSKALQGLRQAINDTIEVTRHLSPAKTAEMDEALASRGIVTLSKLRKRYWSKYKKIVLRKAISNETEYYLIVGLLSDMSINFDIGERENLSKMVDAFEEKYAT